MLTVCLLCITVFLHKKNVLFLYLFASAIYTEKHSPWFTADSVTEYFNRLKVDSPLETEYINKETVLEMVNDDY